MYRNAIPSLIYWTQIHLIALVLHLYNCICTVYQGLDNRCCNDQFTSRQPIHLDTLFFQGVHWKIGICRALFKLVSQLQCWNNDPDFVYLYFCGYLLFIMCYCTSRQSIVIINSNVSVYIRLHSFSRLLNLKNGLQGKISHATCYVNYNESRKIIKKSNTIRSSSQRNCFVD